ncbi:hypothetical protein DL764_007380 [Monosporascus ibericus]|uniref:Uncharacterized protein n=1 Tax=Monosporascus ibericus TaxID=155417 RepID=A0A4Q4T1K6_9PEZI|nr:hypothetical protein DL764_007380 [Monosporascus ibericus]
MGSGSSTQFVPNGELVIAESFQPCHLFGDPDLFGLGIRLSFYVQYFTAFLALLVAAISKKKSRRDKLHQDYRNLRISVTVLALAIFLALCINSTGDSLVILDWALVTVLVLSGLLILGIPLFAARILSQLLILINRDVQQELDSLDGRRDEAESEFREARLRAAQNLARNYYIATAISRQESQRSKALWRQRQQAVDSFVSRLNRYNDDFRPEQRSESSRAGEDRLDDFNLGVLMTELQQSNTRVEQDAECLQMLNQKVSKLREQAAAAKVRAALLKKKHKGGQESFILDEMSASFLILSWLAFIYALPWLYFRGLYNGTKPACDVRIPLIVYPVSIYNHRFITFMRFGAVFGAVVAGPILFCIVAKYAIEGWRNGAGIRPVTPQQSESEHRDDSDEMKEAKYDAEKAFKLLERWLDYGVLYWMASSIITTIVTMEVALSLNHIDITAPPSSTGQLIALVVALGQFVMVFYHSVTPQQYTGVTPSETGGVHDGHVPPSERDLEAQTQRDQEPEQRRDVREQSPVGVSHSAS